jgi:hypothetical protein
MKITSQNHGYELYRNKQVKLLPRNPEHCLFLGDLQQFTKHTVNYRFPYHLTSGKPYEYGIAILPQVKNFKPTLNPFLT